MPRSFDEVRSWYRTNADSSRTLAASIIAPEVRAALEAWAALKVPGILIGGLALSYWSVPRHTQDIDYLVGDLPRGPLAGFKQTRPHAWVHFASGVEVEVLDPPFLNLTDALYARVESLAAHVHGVLIATPASLIALKLNRFSRQDQADIENLLRLTTKNEVLAQFKDVLSVQLQNRLSEF